MFGETAAMFVFQNTLLPPWRLLLVVFDATLFLLRMLRAWVAGFITKVAKTCDIYANPAALCMMGVGDELRENFIVCTYFSHSYCSILLFV